MANKYFRKPNAFSFQDIMRQFGELKHKYEKVAYYKSGRNIEIYIRLQPTEDSPRYTAKIVTRPGDPSVKVFIVEPEIVKYARNRSNKIPHTYGDGSLCLYLPGNDEWSYYDSWAETLIPWTSLWLYYFEIWLVTGEWLGGGAHPGDKKNSEK